MSLHIETGHPTTQDVQTLPATGVRFVTDDGRTMFEAHIGNDGKSIEVRGVDFVWVEGVPYESSLTVCPNAANSLTIRRLPYNA